MSYPARKSQVEKAPELMTVSEISRCIIRAKNYPARSKKAQRMLAHARGGFGRLPNHERTPQLHDALVAGEASHG